LENKKQRGLVSIFIAIAIIIAISILGAGLWTNYKNGNDISKFKIIISYNVSLSSLNYQSIR